ncbi:MAG: alkyl sulfatase dimerization domain-containing protein [Promethearchaeota archaeon]
MSEKKIEEIQVLVNAPPLKLFNPLKDVHTARLPIAGAGWIETDEGVVLIDTLINRNAAKIVHDKIHENKGLRGKVKYIIYTHGHGDHTGGAGEFLDDKPEIIASEYLPARFDKYKMLAQHRNRIGAQQFATQEIKITKEMQEKIQFVYPTKTFLGEMTFSLGDKTFELHAVRAETDDAVWIWIPELKAAFLGDLLIGSFPNIGNPWKPSRYALSWAEALEKVREKEPEYIFYNGAGLMREGKEEVRKALSANIEVIRNLFEQVIDYINKGVHISEMIHKVKVPDHLKNNPYLRLLYSRPEFFVYNVYRWYHGYFDGNPATLLPRPQKESKVELLKLIGKPEKILNRSRELHKNNQSQLALEVLDVLIQAEPENIDARKLHIELLQEIGSSDYCLMSRNAWVYFIKKDKEFLQSKGIDI